jgi:hypothetical protein
MRRVLDRYDHPPSGGSVTCVDEFGLLPDPGASAPSAAYGSIVNVIGAS